MKTAIRLTLTAQRHAELVGVVHQLQGLKLEAWAVPGDRVELADAGGPAVFVIVSRTLVASEDGESTLVFNVDYPARPKASC